MIGRRGLLLGLLAAPAVAKAAAAPALAPLVAGEVALTPLAPVEALGMSWMVPPAMAAQLQAGLATFREARREMDLAEMQLLGEME